MYKGKRILATICARGGSKGVKNKNIRLLDNKPLIGYSLDLLINNSIVDDYVISTDSDEIIQVVRNLDFIVDFKRPPELAEDHVSRIDAIKHAVKWKESHTDQPFDIIADLGVATPLKNRDDLSNAIRLCIDNKADNILTVCPSSRNPYFNMVEVIDGKVRISKELKNINSRQQAPAVYDMNDAFNIWRKEVLFADDPQFNESTLIYIMPRDRSVDIDEEEDFQFAELIIKRNQDE